MKRFVYIVSFIFVFSLLFFPNISRAAEQYLLSSDDVLSITVLNQPALSGVYTVSPDGTIRIPVAGEMMASGIGLGELEKKITDALQARYVNPEVTVSLRTPRSLRIYVFGAIKSPGAFELKDSKTVVGAIAAAGGLTLQADQCRANLFRAADSAIIPVNIQSALSVGDSKANLPLAAGDVLNIEPINKIPVYLAGSGIASGFFMLPEGTTLSQAIAIAGGIKGKESELSAGISRGNQIIPVKLADNADMLLQSGDNVIVESTLITIYVSGEVNKPGMYTIPNDKGLVEAITMAGGLTPFAATGQVTLTSGETVLQDIDYITMAENGKNLPMRNGDRIVVPTSTARIAVLGQVNSPGNFTFDERRPMTVIDAIALAKGALPRAANTHVSVIRMVNGVPTRIPVDLRAILKSLDLSTNIALKPDDIVYVPETTKINWEKTLSTMVSLGVLNNAINR